MRVGSFFVTLILAMSSVVYSVEVSEVGSSGYTSKFSAQTSAIEILNYLDEHYEPTQAEVIQDFVFDGKYSNAPISFNGVNYNRTANLHEEEIIFRSILRTIYGADKPEILLDTQMQRLNISLKEIQTTSGSPNALKKYLHQLVATAATIDGCKHLALYNRSALELKSYETMLDKYAQQAGKPAIRESISKRPSYQRALLRIKNDTIGDTIVRDIGSFPHVQQVKNIWRGHGRYQERPLVDLLSIISRFHGLQNLSSHRFDQMDGLGRAYFDLWSIGHSDIQMKYLKDFIDHMEETVIPFDQDKYMALSASDKTLLILAFSRVNYDETIIKTAQNYAVGGQPISVIIELIETLSALSKIERINLPKQIEESIPRVKWKEKGDLMTKLLRMISPLSTVDRQSALFAAMYLINRVNIKTESINIVQALQRLPEKDYMAFALNIMQFTRIFPVIIGETALLLSSLNQDQRDTFLVNAQDFLELPQFHNIDSSVRTSLLNCLFHIATAERYNFIEFIRGNNIQNLQDVSDLCQVNRADWEATWAGIQAREVAARGIGIETPVVGLRNQTVHDRETEQSIGNSLQKLDKRYSRQQKLSQTEIVSHVLHVGDELKAKSRISDDERGLIDLYFAGVGDLDEESRSIFTRYLNLVRLALEDKAAHSELPQALVGANIITQEEADTYPREYTEQDREDNWSTWFKSAIVDAQIAYWTDSGQKGLPPRSEWVKYKSCVGGSLNRLIQGLTLQHPDVVVREGQQALHNAAEYKKTQLVARIGDYGQDEEGMQMDIKEALAIEKSKSSGGDLVNTPQLKHDVEAYVKGKLRDILEEDGGFLDTQDGKRRFDEFFDYAFGAAFDELSGDG